MRELIAVIVKKTEQKFGGPSLAEFANDPPTRKHYAVAEAILREFDVTPHAEDMGQAANCHLCSGAGGHEDYDGEWIECSCQRPEPQAEPSHSDLIAWHIEQIDALRPFRRSSAHLKASMMHSSTVAALRAAFATEQGEKEWEDRTPWRGLRTGVRRSDTLAAKEAEAHVWSPRTRSEALPVLDTTNTESEDER